MRTRLIGFFRSSVVYVVGMFVIRASGLITMPILTRYLPKEEYGLLSVANSIGAFLLTLFGIGSAEYVMRFYWEKDDEGRKKFFGSFILILLFLPLMLFVMPLTLLGEGIFGTLFREVPFAPYIVLVIWASWLQNLNILPYAFLKIRNQAKRYVALTVSSTVSNVGLTLLLVIVFSCGALGVLAAKFALAALFGVYFIVYTRREVRVDFSAGDAKLFLTFNLPLLLSQLCASFMHHADVFILQKYVSLEVVAVYSVALSIAGLVPFFVRAVNMAWVPFFYENVCRGEDQEDKRVMFGYSIDYILLVVMFLICGMISFRYELTYLLASKQYLGACEVLIVLIVGCIFDSMMGFSARGILLANRNILFTAITASGTLINIALMFVLVRRLGMYGAAFATAASFLFMYAATHIASQKYYGIEYHYGRIARLFLTAVLIAGTAMILDQGTRAAIENTDSLTELARTLAERGFLKAALLVIGYPVLLWISGYFNEREKAFLGRLLRRPAPAGREAR
ncbi:MAG: oligosaccharide flippase family protein [bacterium]